MTTPPAASSPPPAPAAPPRAGSGSAAPTPAPARSGFAETARSGSGASAPSGAAEALRSGSAAPARSGPAAPAPYDPLRLCIYATIAALAWLLGPVAVVGFALLGFAGYVRARRRGLTRSKCFLRDTRLVLTYLAALALAATAAIAWQLFHLFT